MEEAYTVLYQCFPGLDHSMASTLIKGFPTDATSLLSDFTANDLHTPPTRRLLQKQLTGAVAAHQRVDLRASCDHRKVEPMPGTSTVDMLQTHLVTSRSQQTRILQSPLFYKENRVTALPLVFFLRYYVGLPPLIRRGRATQPVSECDAALICFEHRVVPPKNNRGYVEEVCALNHGEQCGLGPTAGHSINCPSTFAARYRAHNGYTRLFQTAAGWLDTIVCHREPPTTGILMDELTYDECRALCPKILTVEKAALATLFHETMMQLASIDINIAGHETEMTDVQHRIATAITALGNSTKGVRLDLLIELPDGQRPPLRLLGRAPNGGCSPLTLEEIRNGPRH